MPQLSSPVCLVVRCFAEKKGDQWQAFSLEFGLAAQADSCAEVEKKLNAMIQSYLYDALVGEDRQHALELLSRSAPWWVFARYHSAHLFNAVRRSMDIKTFIEPWCFEPRRAG